MTTSTRDYQAAYRAAHREETAAYHAANREKIAAQQTAYRAAHREERAAYCRSYNASHREEISIRKAAYYDSEGSAARYAANRVEKCAQQTAYRAAHPEECAAKTRRYRARKRGVSGSHTAADVCAQYERQRGRCFWCDLKVPLRGKHVDHVIPIVLGGSNGPENLVISCPRCNDSKGAKHPMDFAGRTF